MKDATQTLTPAAQSQESIADLVRKIIVQLGEDPDRDGLQKTPERFEKALRFLTSGYTSQNALEVVLGVGTYTMSTLANRLTRAPLDDQLTAFA